MGFNSHYVPQFLLRRFSKRITTYSTASSKIETGLKSDEPFVVQGLYEDKTENLLDQYIETGMNRLLDWVEGSESLDDTEKVSKLRLFIVISYLRTPYVKYKTDGRSWTEALNELIVGGLNDLSDCLENDLVDEETSSAASFLSKAEISVVKSRKDTDSFLISDRGPTFMDADNAVYPFSAHSVLWIGTPPDGDPIDNEGVMRINCRILEETFAVVGMPSLESSSRSIIQFSRTGKDTERFGELVHKAGELGDRVFQVDINDEGHLVVPTKYHGYLGRPVDGETMASIIKGQDYDLYAALIALDRFGLLGKERSVPEEGFLAVPKETAREGVRRKVENANCEFDKCVGIVYLERYAQLGNGESCDKLRRYYEDGRHVIRDPERSLFYRDMGCRYGEPDCLIAFYKSLYDDPDYLAKIDRYPKKLIEYHGIAALVFANIYLKHGDTENYLFYLEKSARLGYEGALSTWLKYWMNGDHMDIAKMEAMNHILLDGKHSTVLSLASIYHKHPEEFPGKYEWLLGKMRECGSRFVYQIELMDKKNR